MSPILIVGCISGYFILLLTIAWFTSKKAGNFGYFLGNKSSPWIVVAFGMIGDSLSGVTFISLPGTVVNSQFGYLQLVLGYLVGYAVIARVLLPVYYRLNLISIYGYLQSRFGNYSQKTGSFYFLISRIIGASLRLYLAVAVLQYFVFDHWGIPFFASVAIIITLMMIYTYRGGIKTLVWTDMFQSGILLLGVVLSIIAIMNNLNWDIATTVNEVRKSSYAQVFFWDWREKSFFFKQFLSGAFIAIVMTGLDQNMMQKNLSCRSLSEAQKNLQWFSVILVIVNTFFVSLGALLYIYASKNGIDLPINPETGKIITDKVFPHLALNSLGSFAALAFIIGLTAATFNSADSVLTTLTTSFCVDFLQLNDEGKYTERRKTTIRHAVHIGFAFVLLIAIMISSNVNQTSVLDAIFTVAAYTYGPLLGLFAFGLFTKWNVKDKLVPLVCIIPPFICYFLNTNSAVWFNGYKFSYELLLVNGIITFGGLWMVRKKYNAESAMV